MQAVILWTLGTSWPHSRMASPVHICCASDEKAGLWSCGKRRRRDGDGEEKCDLCWYDGKSLMRPQGCARCWPLFIGGAARGLHCRTRHPSRGNHPVWLLDFCRCSNQKCCAAPLANYAPMLRSCNGSRQHFLDCCVHATSTKRRCATMRLLRLRICKLDGLRRSNRCGSRRLHPPTAIEQLPANARSMARLRRGRVRPLPAP